MSRDVGSNITYLVGAENVGVDIRILLIAICILKCRLFPV